METREPLKFLKNNDIECMIHCMLMVFVGIICMELRSTVLISDFYAKLVMIGTSID